MRPPPGIIASAGQTYTDSTGQRQASQPGITTSDGQRDSTGQPVTLYWKPNRSIYGLRQSPRCFYKLLDAVVGQHGYTRIPADYGYGYCTNACSRRRHPIVWHPRRNSTTEYCSRKCIHDEIVGGAW